ncbi:uncharacterized protein LOC143147431 [Ptiloglossa arizonensis]|uniref:uncharacterized protein LOC143147431 n=1 Tax=Ptiloglossa arizonensis TaxID=3350558 RepID=UPI003FA0B038
MILESVLSCSYLLLTCGSCIYILIRHSYNRYHRLFPHFVCACTGIVTIGARSLFVLVYKLFFKQYTLDAVMMELEEKRNRGRINNLDELLGTLSLASIHYALYCHHEYHIIGACIITSLSILDAVRLYKFTAMQPQSNYSEFGRRNLRYAILQRVVKRFGTVKVYNTYKMDDENNNSASNRSNLRNIIAQIPPFQNITTVSRIVLQAPNRTYIWIFVSAYFSYTVGNNYAFVANYPYLLTTWTLAPEGFYQGWTIRRTINDYMMAAYVIYMTEALRQT